MRTLFLNPNSNVGITEVFRRRIAAHARADAPYEVQRLEGAPSIIASAQDNLQAQAVLTARLDSITHDFERLVLMSSLDTGYDIARQHGSLAVHGFTRSVLEWNLLQGRSLHAVTFDEDMTPLYQALFSTEGCDGVVRRISTVPISPAAVAGSAELALKAVRELCRTVRATPDAPIFIVGAVGLDMAETLRAEGLPIIDPIADLLARLGMCAEGP